MKMVRNLATLFIYYTYTRQQTQGPTEQVSGLQSPHQYQQHSQSWGRPGAQTGDLS